MSKAKSLDSFQPFGSEVERITGITDKDITAEDVSIAVTRILKEYCSMFERKQGIKSSM